MDVRFREPRFELIETHRAAETELPFGVIGTARKRIAVLRAAPDFATLLKWRSFGLAQGAASPGTHSIQVANDWEMMISFEEEGKPISVILSVNEVANLGRAAQ